MNRVYPIEKEKVKVMRSKMSKDTYAKRNQFLFDFMLGIPLRVSDALSLKVEDVRGKEILIITPSKSKRKDKEGVKSSGKKIEYDIHFMLQQKIREFTKDMDDDEYLFQSQKGKNKPLSRQGAWEIIKKAAEQAGIKEPVGCHSTRKTHARQLLEKFDDLTFVMQQLGHSDPTSTMRYLHLTDEKRKERINSLNLYD